jgi:signal transduction histidine kinase
MDVGKSKRAGFTPNLAQIALADPLRQVDTLLGRMGPAGATFVLAFVAVIAALGILLVIAALGGPALTWTVARVTTVVTVTVAVPIIRYSQHLIRKLRASRHDLKEVTSRLAIALQNAEQAGRAKSTFLANMSHELRTPLNAIIGFSEMIRDQHLGPVGNSRYRSYAGDIHVSGTHLLSIINDVLDLSKIEAGKMSLDDAEEFDLRTATDIVSQIVRPTAEHAEISVSVKLPNVRLVAVKRMVQQVLINLLTNALKFTAKAGSVSLTGALQSDGSCTLTVSDNGVGMTQDEIIRALEPFGQIDNSMSRKHTGTGLGLPLSKAMVELHGGSLHIQSVPQQGTQVSVTFPCWRIVAQQEAPLLSATN